MTSRFLTIVLALCAGTALAVGPMVDITWARDGRFQHRASIAAGKFIELCGKLAAGERVHWRYEASAALDFNIHHHAGQEVVYSAREEQVTGGAGQLAVAQAQDYCWMWTNKGDAPVRLSVELQR